MTRYGLDYEYFMVLYGLPLLWASSMVSPSTFDAWNMMEAMEVLAMFASDDMVAIRKCGLVACIWQL